MSGSTQSFLKKYWLLLVFVVLKMVAQYLVVNPVYELQRDEYLYLDQANHLAMGYASVPPLTSWISLIIQALGNGIFWVRFFPALSGAATMVMVWLTINELGGTIRAQVLAGCALLFSALLRLNILFQPNSFDILAWTTIFYFLIKYIHTLQNRWLFWFAVAVGVGFLNKYNVVFLVAGLLPAMVISSYRKLFVNRYFYYAIALALLIILPNLIWQVQHNYPVVHHMKELNDHILANGDRKAFLFTQLLFFIGSDPVILAAFVAFAVYKPFRQYRIIGCTYLFTMLIFTWLRAKDYYAFGLYPVLLAFGPVYIERICATGWKRYIVPALVALNLILFFPLVQAVFPVLAPGDIEKKGEKFKALGLLRWEDGKDHPIPEDFADMLGWKEMADKTLAVYKQLPDSEKTRTLVLTDNYGEAGAINYFNRGQMPPGAPG